MPLGLDSSCKPFNKAQSIRYPASIETQERVVGCSAALCVPTTWLQLGQRFDWYGAHEEYHSLCPAAIKPLPRMQGSSRARDPHQVHRAPLRGLLPQFEVHHREVSQ